MHMEYETRAQYLRTGGQQTTLTRNELNMAALGFKSMIKFDDMTVFVCPHCGLFPKYLVCDGKCSGLKRSKIRNASELNKAANDKEVLQQGSVASDRNFLKSKEEPCKAFRQTELMSRISYPQQGFYSAPAEYSQAAGTLAV